MTIYNSTGINQRSQIIVLIKNPTAIMIAKIAGFADATSEPGLYYFMGSLALVTLATFRIERAGEKAK